jgi:iron complex outermembrane recepter protein
METRFHRKTLLLGLAVFAACASALGQGGNPDQDTVFELSPFEVETSGDKGYYASNAISGSRINVRIQDMPLTIEVVTSEFISDTGATDLRDSLRYSSGILLQSQNDAYGLFDNAGNVNNPEGATGDKSQSGFKIRGFVVENTLRNGFRRQHATDTINIDRIEVVRGPSALLYGVGNFGGVVNYLPKKPLEFARQEVALTIGNDGFRRATIDSTTPLPIESLSYRLTMAYEEREDWTDLFSHEHFFISPIVEYRPFKKTKLTLDFEYGEAEDNAISFKSVRTPTVEGVNVFQTDRLETYGFLEFDGKDPRTFRWSGPDTFVKTDSINANILLEQGITDDLNLLVGYNYSDVEFHTRDVFAGIVVNSSNVNAQPYLATIQARQIIDGANTDVVVPIERAVLQYNWNDGVEQVDWHQARAELNYSKRVFQDSRWLSSEHNLLLGYSYEQKEQDNEAYRTKDREGSDIDASMFKSPVDSSYLRFDTRPDGTPSLPMGLDSLSGVTVSNEGLYLVYSGRFLKDRLYVVAGMRQDTTTSEDGYFKENFFGRNPVSREFPSTTVRKRTSQFGVSYEILDGLTAYALKSEGVEPNFGGQRDGWGNPLESSVADSEEFGIKINLWDGKVAASISRFKIQREDFPITRWWAPAPIKGQFRRNEPIVFRMDDFNPDVKTTNVYLQAALEEWNAAKAARAVYDKESEDGRSVFKYLNASTPEGAAYLDAVFDALKAEFAKPADERTDGDPWPGWLYTGADESFDPEVNTAARDRADGDFFSTISDESKGWEAQITLTPNDNFQVILTYSNVERTILDPGFFVEYDYAEGNWDRWAPWYFPNIAWGLAGLPTADIYPGGPAENLPNPDTSSWTGLGWGKGESLDDTPKHVFSWWATYRFTEDVLNGFQLGLGGQWESKREYFSALTSAGQKKLTDTGEKIQAFTDPRLTVSAMAKYTWYGKNDSYQAYIQLNVDNVLDDTDQYGFVYAPGRSWKLNMGVTF